MNLRPYQAKAIEQIREHFRLGQRRVMLHLATGGGKTHCFSFMMIEAANRGVPCLMLVRGRKLIDQASTRLHREGVHHGVIMAGRDWAARPSALIQLSSIDTLIARKLRPFADRERVLIVIDEAHQATSDGYVKVLADYPNAHVVAVTATPYSRKPLRHLAGALVHPVTVQKLVDMGNLVAPKYYAPSNPDVSRVKVSQGDYVASQLAEVLDTATLRGDLVFYQQKLARGKPTLVFAINVEHSKHIAEQYRAAGVRAEHCDADTPDAERERIVREFAAGEIEVLTNVGIFCTGVDIPPLYCIQMARATKSYALYIQQLGRGTRPYPGKDHFLVLDHAGNIARHGFITDEPTPNLDGVVPTPVLRGKQCEVCFAVVEAFPCPAEVYGDDGEVQVCGWQPPAAPPRPEREILHVEGELREIIPPSPARTFACDRFCEDELQRCLDKKVNPWRAYYKAAEEFGEAQARLSFFRICKANGVDLNRKKREATPGFPFK